MRHMHTKKNVHKGRKKNLINESVCPETEPRSIFLSLVSLPVLELQVYYRVEHGVLVKSTPKERGTRNKSEPKEKRFTLSINTSEG
jgi:uncharacterized protein YbbC (DUF1343 family)